VSSVGTYVPESAARPVGPVGRCVSAADSSLSLSLSLSLSCTASTADLTAEAPRICSPLAGYGHPYLAPCSKLPCHARNDVRRPHEVTRDRSLAYTHANGRQAHCERYCRAPGGVAGTHRAFVSHRAWVSHRVRSLTGRRGALVRRAPGGVAGTPHASSLQRAPYRTGRTGRAA
jgi:hypothetical protein